MEERRQQQGKQARCCSPGKGGEGHSLKNYSFKKSNVQEEREMASRVKHPGFYYGSARGPGTLAVGMLYQK